ncbi:MAG: replication-associated recombination protein A, partial [Lachnospiraceae bacterium]|nr:replication-associated recombination protein A [Lachnospiraceae bacterium]
APKSNSAVNAIFDAMREVENSKTPPIPGHLMDAHYKGAAKLGHGDGYRYSHDYPNHYCSQQYLPDALVGKKFYIPGDLGLEKQLKEYMEKIRREAKE